MFVQSLYNIYVYSTRSLYTCSEAYEGNSGNSNVHTYHKFFLWLFETLVTSAPGTPSVSILTQSSTVLISCHISATDPRPLGCMWKAGTADVGDLKNELIQYSRGA